MLTAGVAFIVGDGCEGNGGARANTEVDELRGLSSFFRRGWCAVALVNI